MRVEPDRGQSAGPVRSGLESGSGQASRGAGLEGRAEEALLCIQVPCAMLLQIHVYIYATSKCRSGLVNRSYVHKAGYILSLFFFSCVFNHGCFHVMFHLVLSKPFCF